VKAPHVIHREEVSEYYAGGATTRFVTEASDIGLRAGQWPEAIQFAERVGNGLPFYRTHSDANSVTYEQDLGCTKLVVFND
jgi:hypothetical protein